MSGIKLIFIFINRYVQMDCSCSCLFIYLVLCIRLLYVAPCWLQCKCSTAYLSNTIFIRNVCLYITTFFFFGGSIVQRFSVQAYYISGALAPIIKLEEICYVPHDTAFVLFGLADPSTSSLVFVRVSLHRSGIRDE